MDFKNKDPSFRMVDFRYVDAHRKILHQRASNILKLREGLRTDNLTRAFIRDAEHNFSTALICQGAAIPAEFLHGEFTPCFLEFEAFAFCSVQPLLELLCQVPLGVVS